MAALEAMLARELLRPLSTPATWPLADALAQAATRVETEGETHVISYAGGATLTLRPDSVAFKGRDGFKVLLGPVALTCVDELIEAHVPWASTPDRVRSLKVRLEDGRDWWLEHPEHGKLCRLSHEDWSLGRPVDFTPGELLLTRLGDLLGIGPEQDTAAWTEWYLALEGPWKEVLASGARFKTPDKAYTLARLTRLRLDGRSVASLEPLRRLTSLKTLELFGQPLRPDFSALSALPSLEELSVTNAPDFTDLSVLRRLTRLSTLRVERCGLRSLDGVPPGLSRLNVGGNAALVSLAGIEVASGLTHLDFWQTQVDDLTPLPELRNLMHVGGSTTPLADLTPLSRLNRLGDVELTDTHVTSLTPLGPCRRVSVRRARVPFEEVLAHIDRQQRANRSPDCLMACDFDSGPALAEAFSANPQLVTAHPDAAMWLLIATLRFDATVSRAVVWRKNPPSLECLAPVRALCATGIQPSAQRLQELAEWRDPVLAFFEHEPREPYRFANEP